MENIHEKIYHAIEHLGDSFPKTKKKITTRADYGQDIPLFTLLLFLIGLVFAILAFLLFKGIEPSSLLLATILSVLLGLIGLIGTTGGIFLVWASRVGKYQMRDHLMAQIEWKGDEQVLDVGCGSGLLLIGAAKHLTTGKAIGVDIWDRNLEYGSSPENVWANAKIEGVFDRIEVKDGNACSLPFPEELFDLVFSSNMLHHLSQKQRSQAIQEMTRVLKPGGKLVIAEIAFINQIIQTLKTGGIRDVMEKNLDMILWRSVIATK